MKKILLALLFSSLPLAAQVPIKGSTVNATVGYQYQGGAPNGWQLCGNGTTFIASATCGGTAFYQFVASNGTNLPQRPILDFSNAFSLGSTGSTEVDLASLGSAGTYTFPASITTDVYGRVTSITSSTQTPVTCNVNGCYEISATGKITAWGVVTGTFASASVFNVSIIYPVSFPNQAVLTTDGASQADGTDDSYVVFHKNSSLFGATAVARCSVNIGGSGCAGSLSTSIPIHWQAVGY